MSGRERLGCTGEEELGAFVWRVCHFLPIMLEAEGRVIPGYHTEAGRLRWSKMLFHLRRTFNTSRNEHQLKHRWADLVAREQDLLDHLGVVIGGPVGEYPIDKCVQLNAPE
ncbi:hypothetical protein NDU88_004127 [Pleurodeles waltl]|uniref:Uncharacterized protein n=1 Tax=Pleurodeles waltl TaxID=8319 RepID=A0AAV7WUY4_PLEWA|nr:hypothetical protein NDU88_004127 [Pleurodeles waltl]